jgi:NADH-quinone oxidoreductase subunit L
MDFASNPGLIFVVATLLPLASFVFILLANALRAALRPSPEGSVGAQLYQAMGGNRPWIWPAWVATGAIGLAFVCTATGFVWYLNDSAQHHELEQEAEGLKKQLHPAEHKAELLEQKIEDAKDAKEKAALETQHKAAIAKIESLEADLKPIEEETGQFEPRWSGSVEWLKISPVNVPDTERGTILTVGYKIDTLSGVMFVMVSFIATLIHLFSIGYMSEEKEQVVEDHFVHTPEGHLQRPGRFGRFFLFLSLFCFSMLNLVLADNLFQVFVSWELVGICSYLLIGYYFERQSASDAANKAFITNRIGDAGFIIGLMIVWTYAGTFNFDSLFRQVRAPSRDAHGEPVALADHIIRGNVTVGEKGKKELTIDARGSDVLLLPRKPHLHAEDLQSGQKEEVKDSPKERQFGHMPYWVLVAAGLGIFLGCVGKSAQFPLQVWLPDAMEGPTPVSALIHAATMVAAGVYFVGRVYPLFTPEVLLVIAYTGGITLFVAATIAVVMTDIKKVLAYSTVSQLGYMMLALGIGGWVAGLFHLITHAFFKALLFLCSGSVIYGCHHEQDMMKMGGLYPKMKITALTMLMGVLAISGIPGFSGWYSKDAIVAQAMGYAYANPGHILLFLLPLVTAGITTFYMFRMWFLTFTGPPRDHHVHEHAHETPPMMTGPLVVLAIFSVCIGWGYAGEHGFFSGNFPFLDAHASWLMHQLEHAQPLAVQAEFGLETSMTLQVHHLAGNLALGMVILGLVFASVLYYYRTLDAAEGAAQFPGVARFLQAKWYFDELYSVALVRPALVMANWCREFDLRVIDWLLNNSAYLTVRVARWDGRFDNRVIDGLVNLVATVAYGIAGWFRKWQTGYLRSYVLFLVLAAVGIFVVLSYFTGMPR